MNRSQRRAFTPEKDAFQRARQVKRRQEEAIACSCSIQGRQAADQQPDGDRASQGQKVAPDKAAPEYAESGECSTLKFRPLVEAFCSGDIWRVRRKRQCGFSLSRGRTARQRLAQSNNASAKRILPVRRNAADRLDVSQFQ